MKTIPTFSPCSPSPAARILREAWFLASRGWGLGTALCLLFAGEALAQNGAGTNPQDPPAPTNPAASTNRDEVLRQALDLALQGKTNAAAVKAANAGADPGPSQPPFTRNPRGSFRTNAVLNPSSPTVTTTATTTTTTTTTNLPPALGALPPGTVAITPPPGTTNAPPEELVPAGFIDFRGVDINQVLQVYAELVNRTILRPATLPVAGQIVLKTQTALTRREAVQALDAVLGMNNIAMINVGEKFVKAEQVPTANTAGAEFSKMTAGQLPDFGPYTTHVVQLKYARPSEMVQLLQAFAKIPNAILPIDSSQILVLRDFTENVKRMLEMIEKVDVVIPSEFVQEVIPIKYAKASEIANALNSLSTGGGGTTVGASGGGGASPRTTSSRGGTGGGYGRPGGTGGIGGVGGYQGQNTGGIMNQANPALGGGGANPGANSFTDRLRNIINKASVTGDIQVLGQTKMIADERTNSLLIYASREDMKVIKDIVAKLDVVLAQVLIEAVIIEVSLNNSRDLGLSYVEKKNHGIGNYFSGSGGINNGNLISAIATNATSPTLPGGLSYIGSFGNDLDVTLTALASDSRAKILQRPRIQTSHNEPAVLFVGQSRPYPTGSSYGGAYGNYATIQQLQIGVTLEVTPLINPDGLVVMDIHQKIDSFQGNVNITGVGDVPITSSKEASAKVSVRDHDTIILGGLIETDKNRNNSGVPFLKDIPGLGALFRSSHNDETHNELIVMIRPTVLPTPEVAAMTALAEKDQMSGVKHAEAEIRADEDRRQKQLEKALAEEEKKKNKKKSSP